MRERRHNCHGADVQAAHSIFLDDGAANIRLLKELAVTAIIVGANSKLQSYITSSRERLPGLWPRPTQ